jgi:hypothetical protein
MAAGYSGTPLAKKLGYKEGVIAYVAGAPANYKGLVSPLPPGCEFRAAPGEDLDLAHVFARERSNLAKALPPLIKAIRRDGMIWVSWPKKASKVATDITEDVIREIALPLGLVDVKVCALDDVWSGLKLVIRKERR